METERILLFFNQIIDVDIYIARVELIIMNDISSYVCVYIYIYILEYNFVNNKIKVIL